MDAIWTTFLLICSTFFAVDCADHAPYEDIARFKEEYSLPALSYAYDGLEPFVDQATLRVHHLGHHAGYTKKMNTALKAWRASGKKSDLASKSILTILKSIDEVPEEWRLAIKNNGGGYVNHALYWAIMSPNPSKEPRQPTGKIARLIDQTYGNFTQMKKWFDG
ncbi:uncharacterized protein LOC116292988, partial [Actinia tenebrosa]|uniref:superoxide dismutase n=1 Tax=Actinia tenebrosa TaxID=6105 RepID=A0A6P8HUF0_ACTTE